MYLEESSPTDVENSLTDGQEKLLSLLPILPSLLSVFGSATIIHMVLTSKRKMTPYKRLLLGMSICDTIISLTVPLYPFLVPKQTSHRVWANGNDASCTAIGFFSQMTFSSILYNTFLTFYYLLTIRYGYKDPQISKCAEPIIHCVSFGYPVLTGLIGAVLGVYGELDIGAQCWVNNWPENCGEGVGNTGEPCLSPMIGFIFGGSVIFFAIISIVVNNYLIYSYVRGTIERGRQRSTVTQDNTLADSQIRRIRAVATQGFFYVGTFILSYTWPIVIRISEGMLPDGDYEATLFPLLVFNAIFMPMQGFFNLLVYVRPNYLRVRRDYPDATRFWCFRRALHGNAVERKTSRKDDSRITNTAYFIPSSVIGFASRRFSRSSHHPVSGISRDSNFQSIVSEHQSTSGVAPPTRINSKVRLQRPSSRDSSIVQGGSADNSLCDVSEEDISEREDFLRKDRCGEEKTETGTNDSVAQNDMPNDADIPVSPLSGRIVKAEMDGTLTTVGLTQEQDISLEGGDDSYSQGVGYGRTFTMPLKD